MQLKEITFKNARISYSMQGKGKTIVLLHGYLESQDIWNGFATELAKKFQLIAVDLPGHGKSGTINGEATVELMAESIRAILDFEKIDKVVIIGHSMGGYAMLAFAEKWPEMLNGIGLFHSITWADLPEKREARDREIELVKQGKKNLIFNINVPKGFATDNINIFKNEVERAQEIATHTSDEGIIAALNGMKNRQDRTGLLEKLNVPVFFAIGMKDNYIPSEKLLSLSLLPAKKHIAIFENSGHMAFIEEKERAVDEIEQFLLIC